MKKTWILAGIAGAVGIAGYMGLSRSEASGLPYQDRSVTRKGAELYAENCAGCHGENLQGQSNWKSRDADGYLPAPPHDPTGHTWHHPDAQLIAITTYGTERLVGGGYKSRMSGFEGILDESEVIAVLAYIKSTWPQDVIEIHNKINSDAQN